MRRVLVPLDGSHFAEAILPDARRLAGPDGELILVQEANAPLGGRDRVVGSQMHALEGADWYLCEEAKKLQYDGVKVETESLFLADAASAIDEAVKIFKADMIAIASHGRRPFGRLIRGGVAWKALAHSPVPVLLRHVEDSATPASVEEDARRIMVPLDGSSYAEKALPLARQLALEWGAPVWLVQVIPDALVAGAPYMAVPASRVADEDDVRRSHAYLEGLAASFRSEVHIEASLGPIVGTLVNKVERLSITDIVMATHGRTGLTRVILGSVADELIHRLHEAIIVVPALVASTTEEKQLNEDMSMAVH